MSHYDAKVQSLSSQTFNHPTVPPFFCPTCCLWVCSTRLMPNHLFVYYFCSSLCPSNLSSLYPSILFSIHPYTYILAIYLNSIYLSIHFFSCIHLPTHGHIFNSYFCHPFIHLVFSSLHLPPCHPSSHLSFHKFVHPFLPLLIMSSVVLSLQLSSCPFVPSPPCKLIHSSTYSSCGLCICLFVLLSFHSCSSPLSLQLSPCLCDYVPLSFYVSLCFHFPAICASLL